MILAQTPHQCPTVSVSAMLLAAGRGERMRPLTDRTPKPLLAVRGQALIQWHLQALARGGVRQVVINTAWLEEQIVAQIGSVFRLQPASYEHEQLLKQERIDIRYSLEGRDFGGALETAGGISRALPLLFPAAADADQPAAFWLVAGDVFVPGFEFSAEATERFLASERLAHIWLVPNPAHNPKGDFGLDPASGLALNLAPGDPQPRYTYSTIGLYRKALFEPPWCDIENGNPQGRKAALAPLLRAAMDAGLVSAEIYSGDWTDVGTPERLAQLNLT